MSLDTSYYSYVKVQDAEDTHVYCRRKTWPYKYRNGRFLTAFLLVLMLAAPVVALSWTNTTVDSTGNGVSFASLALDGSGNPHISYYDNTNYDLKYAYWRGILGLSALSIPRVMLGGLPLWHWTDPVTRTSAIMTIQNMF